MSSFAALDIGAGKFACLVAGRPDGADAPIEVRGVGRHPAKRGPNGDHPDFNGAARTLAVCVDQALRMAGATDPSFALAYPGPDVASAHLRGEARLPKGVVEARDVAAALAAARRSVELAGRRVLHLSPTGYLIDGARAALDPRGEAGARLAAELCVVHAPEDAVAAMEQLCEAAQCSPRFIAPAPLLSGLAALSEEERRVGAVVLDIGESRIGLAIFRDGVLQHAETIPGGGARISAELAESLQTSFIVAERAKLAYGALSSEVRPNEALEVPLLGDDGRLEPGIVMRSVLMETAAARLGEMLDKVHRRLTELGAPPGADGLGVALTGGVSLTPGIRAIAIHVLKRPVRLAQPLNVGGIGDSEEGAAFASAVGLLRYMAIDAARHAQSPVSRIVSAAPTVRRGLGQAVAWIKENF